MHFAFILKALRLFSQVFWRFKTRAMEKICIETNALCIYPPRTLLSLFVHGDFFLWGLTKNAIKVLKIKVNALILYPPIIKAVTVPFGDLENVHHVRY